MVCYPFWVGVQLPAFQPRGDAFQYRVVTGWLFALLADIDDMSGVHSKERPEIPGHDASSKGMRGFGFSSSLLTWRVEALLSILSSFSFTQPSHSTNIFSTYDTFNTYSGFQWPGKITSSSSPRLEFASILSAALGAPPPTSRIPAPTTHASRPWDPGNSSTATSTGTLHLSSTTTLSMRWKLTSNLHFLAFLPWGTPPFVVDHGPG